jgi:hypothetical protein
MANEDAWMLSKNAGLIGCRGIYIAQRLRLTPDICEG